MTKFQRIGRILTGLLMLFCAAVMIIFSEVGFALILAIIGLTLFFRGISMLIYYFRMAKHMVGGKYMLYMGLIVADFGAFTLALTDIPKIYIVLYLIGIYAFSGAIDILRAFESKNYGGSWVAKLVSGIMNILIAIFCLVFINSNDTLVYFYTGSLIYSAIVRIGSAFKRSAVVYIQ